MSTHLLRSLTFGRFRSFRSRLLLLAGLTSAVAVILVTVALVSQQHVRMRGLAIEQVVTKGEVLALNVSAALSFDDPDAAREVMDAIEISPHMAAAYVVDDDGYIFVTVELRPVDELPRITLLPPGLHRLGHWMLHYEPVTLNDQYLGSVVLVYDASWLATRLWVSLAVSALIAVVAVGAAMLSAMRLQGALARPVRELVSTSRSVSETGDFSIQARKFDDDELGELTDAFNAMLRRIDRQASEVQQANERFRVAVESAPNAMVMVDESGRIVLVNETAENLFDYTRDELLGQPVEMLVPERLQPQHPGHRTGFFASPQTRPMGAGRDLYARRKDGSEVPVEIGLNPIPTEQGLRVLAAIVDITERKRTEAELRDREQRLTTLTDAVPAVVWSADAQGAITSFNEQWYEYSGLTPEQSLGAAWIDTIHPDDVERINKRWSHSLRTGERYEIEVRIRARDGEYRWFLARAVPLHDEAENITGWFGTTLDIHDRKIAESERDELLASERSARSEAERASRMKDEFVATLSHELRTPLTAILGWAQMLKRQKIEDAAIAEGLDTIERNARSQTQIIEDLLDMSRIVSGKIRLDVQSVDLPEVIEAALGTVRPAAEAKGIRLQKIIDPRVTPVHGDAGRLQQIVWNLLSNAVKFTQRGGRVQIALQRINSHIEINVSDTGEGISPDFLPHLFERFRQSDPTTTREHSGLGIGLALVKHLAELHGGSVRATSPGKGKGATFTVVLPLAIVHPRDDEDERLHPTRSSNGRPEPDVDGSTLEGVRVLVVEDERDARTFIQRLLEGANAEVQCAGSASEALDVIEGFQPNVIVSDIGMPMMDGYQFIRELRQRPAERGGRVPAVALTAFARSEDRTRALVSGYQMHVAKPVEPSELLATIASAASLGR